MKRSLFDYLLGQFFERLATSDARDVCVGALRFSTKVRGSRHMTAIDIPPMEGPVKKDFSAEAEAWMDEAEPGVTCEKCLCILIVCLLSGTTWWVVYSACPCASASRAHSNGSRLCSSSTQWLKCEMCFTLYSKLYRRILSLTVSMYDKVLERKACDCL